MAKVNRVSDWILGGILGSRFGMVEFKSFLEETMRNLLSGYSRDVSFIVP